METKSTPGPWGCKRSETGPWAIFGQDGSWVATTCKKQWASEDLANAILIAAAPDLLAVVQSILNSSTTVLHFDDYTAARAVVAKATGA